MAKADITIEIHDLRNEPSKIFTDAKLSAGVSRIINEKNELQVKYDMLRKDYALLRHECKQKEDLIKTLEEVQEGLLKKISKLHEEQAGFDNAYSVLKDEICKKDLEIKRLKGYLEKLFF